MNSKLSFGGRLFTLFLLTGFPIIMIKVITHNEWLMSFFIYILIDVIAIFVIAIIIGLFGILSWLFTGRSDTIGDFIESYIEEFLIFYKILFGNYDNKWNFLKRRKK